MPAFFRKLFRRREESRSHLSPSLEELFKDGDIPPELRAAFTVGSQVDIVPGASGRFGYDKTNPIPVNMQRGEVGYLASLRCECGEPFAFHRLGSFGQGPDGHIVDGYELICRSKTHHITLYMDMYHAGPSSVLPAGLAKGPLAGIGLPFLVQNFPEGLPQAIADARKSRLKRRGRRTTDDERS